MTDQRRAKPAGCADWGKAGWAFRLCGPAAHLIIHEMCDRHFEEYLEEINPTLLTPPEDYSKLWTPPEE